MLTHECLFISRMYKRRNFEPHFLPNSSTLRRTRLTHYYTEWRKEKGKATTEVTQVNEELSEKQKVWILFFK